MSRRRVVVTGLGCVSPVGNTVADAWANILAGKSGIDLITKFDASNFACRIAGEVKGFDLESYISAKDARAMDSFIHFGIAAAAQAVQDAGLPTGEALDDELATRIACVIGSGIGGLPLIENTHIEYAARGPGELPHFCASLHHQYGGWSCFHAFWLQGPNLSVVTACTTGLHCIGEGGRMIEYGDADIVVAGGTESTVSPLGIGGFAAMRALSTRNDDPQTASRPWDKDRDGFVLGEGAGVMVLEEYEHAKARGAKIYAELGGFGMSADAGHMTAPNMDGPRRAMISAMRNAGVNADQIDYPMPTALQRPGRFERNQRHQGCAGRSRQTYGGEFDQVDDRSLARRGRRHRKRLHSAGFASPEGTPTINLFNQDPECDLDYCANTARDMKIDVALKTILVLVAPMALWYSSGSERASAPMILVCCLC